MEMWHERVSVMRKQARRIQCVIPILALGIWMIGCGGDGGPTVPEGAAGHAEYMEVKVTWSTGIDGIGENPELWSSSRDTDADPFRLFIPDPVSGNYFVWFISANGGQVSFTVTTNCCHRTYTKCTVGPSGVHGMSVTSVQFPGGTISDGLAPGQHCDSIE
jgi:hypothetical protein